MTPPEKNIRFDEDAARCPHCGKRLNPEATLCASCGYELIARHPRIRCARCRNRIPADATACPRCGADPRPKPIPRAVRIGALIAIALIALACIGWVAYRAMTTDVLARGLGLIQPSRVPTQIVHVVFVVATPVPPTATLAPLPTITAPPRVSPTATRRGQSAITPQPIAPGMIYLAPQLVAPLNALIFNSVADPVSLEWRAVAPSGLHENEWYAITVAYTGRDASPVTKTHWTRETRWTIPKEWHAEIAPDARTIRWHVGVVRIEGIDPITSPNRAPISPNSAQRTFIWK